MRIQMNNRRTISMNQLRTSNEEQPQDLHPRTLALLSRGPGRIVGEELSRLFDQHPDEVVELDFGDYILKIEKVSKE
jgi:hypothetical protein